ncbi:MAG: hypothetical protein CK604_15365 [Curvibacter sp. PD_MW3]|nr:MAG: hypothetical protein CK604_15365 [Curvibacter sp. PD_MW3]
MWISLDTFAQTNAPINNCNFGTPLRWPILGAYTELINRSMLDNISHDFSNGVGKRLKHLPFTLSDKRLRESLAMRLNLITYIVASIDGRSLKIGTPEVS